MKIVMMTLSFVLLAIGLNSPVHAAVDSPLPAGSYQKTCAVYEYSARTGILNATCNDGTDSQFQIGDSIDTRWCVEGTLDNIYGRLRCIAKQPWGARGAVPNGSYIQTCRNVQMNGGVLQGDCGDGHGGRKTSDLLVEQCRWDRDIWNRYGDLKCEPGTTPAQPLPVAALINPNVIKQPVQTLSPGGMKALTEGSEAKDPPPPSPDAPAAPPEEKKKRKHRGKGERG